MPIIQSLLRNVSFISNSYVVHVDQYTRSYDTESNKIILNDPGTAAVRCPWNEKKHIPQSCGDGIGIHPKWIGTKELRFFNGTRDRVPNAFWLWNIVEEDVVAVRAKLKSVSSIQEWLLGHGVVPMSLGNTFKFHAEELWKIGSVWVKPFGKKCLWGSENTVYLQNMAILTEQTEVLLNHWIRNYIYSKPRK